MKVLWLANIPSPYSVNFFNELGKLCELTVLFELSSASNRDASWKKYSFTNFKGIVLKGKQYSKDKAFCPSVIHYLQKDYEMIVVSNMPTLTGILSIIYLNIKHIPFIMQGDGGFKKDGKGIKEKLKRYLVSSAQYCLSTGKDHDEYYMSYGAEPQSIFRIPFTSVYEKEIAAEPISNETKMLLRDELSLKGERIVLSVGQFIHRKGFDILLLAAEKLKGISIYIVGGQPTIEYQTLINNRQINNVTFLEFMSSDKLRKFYQAADLFVLPTREDIWGLVVNEAMSQGLPVVTTNGCIAGKEMIENGKNGFIVPIEDADALAHAISTIIESENYNAFCSESINKSKTYTIENTAEIHYRLFLKIKEGKNVSNDISI